MEIYKAIPSSTSSCAQHILMLRTDINNRYSDIHFVQTAVAFKKFGHKVSIITCTKHPEIYHKEIINFPIVNVFCWIPCSIFGHFTYVMYILRSLIVALYYLLFPATPKPSVILCNLSCIALPLLYLSGNHIIIHLQNSQELLQLGKNANKAFSCINWILKQSILYSTEVIVTNTLCKKIFKILFKQFKRKAVVFYPHVDLQFMQINDTCDIKCLIPRLSIDGYLFVCFGEYKFEYKFHFILQGFIKALNELEWNIVNKMHLVIAATYDQTEEEHKKYYDYLCNLINVSQYSQHVTLLKNFNVVQKKCLMYEATAVIHAYANDTFKATILEAMFLGKTVITTRSTSTKNILINHVTGFIVSPKSEELAALIRKLVNNKILPLYIGTLAETEFKHKFSFSYYTKYLNNYIADTCQKFYCHNLNCINNCVQEQQLCF